MTIAAVQPKVIDYRCRTKNYAKKKDTHFARAVPCRCGSVLERGDPSQSADLH
jgi:hypothetical protein